MVLKTLDFDHFTTKQLASDVRKSGLYQADKIIERMEQLFEDKNREFETISDKEKETRKEKEQLKKENNQLTTDIKTVKTKLDRSYYEYGPFNPWDSSKYLEAGFKARYSHL